MGISMRRKTYNKAGLLGVIGRMAELPGFELLYG